MVWLRIAWFFPVLALVFTPRYFQENDDAGFVYLLNHSLYAPYLSKPFCQLFFFLHHVQPDWPWYGILQYVVLGISLAVFLRILSGWSNRNNLSPPYKEAILLVGTLFFLPFFLRITYSMTSILSGGIALVGLMNVLYSIQNETPPTLTLPRKGGGDFNLSKEENQFKLSISFPFIKDGLKSPPPLRGRVRVGGEYQKNAITGKHDILSIAFQAVGLGLLFSSCYLFRPEGMGAMVFLLPPIMYFLITAGKYLPWKRALILGSFFLLPVGILYGCDHLYGQYPANQEAYQEYIINSNNTFGFGFTNEFKKDPALLRKLGWFHNDFGLYERFLYFNESIFSHAKINYLAAISPQTVLKHLEALKNPHLLFQRIIMTIGKVWLGHYAYTSVLMLLLLLFSIKGVDRRARYFPWIYWLILFTGSMLMQYCLRFPYRVAYPLLTCCGLTLFALPNYTLPSKNKALIASLFACVVVFNFIFPLVEIKRLHVPEACQKMALLASHLQGQYLIREQGVIPINEVDPLNPNPLARIDMGPGWLLQSIPFYQHLQEFGWHSGMDLLSMSVNNPRMLYFFKVEDLSVIHDYLWQHYQMETHFVPVAGILDAPFYANSHLYRLAGG